MQRIPRRHLARWLVPAQVLTVLAALLVALASFAPAQDKAAGSPVSLQVAKTVGTIISIKTDTIMIAAESGGEITAKLSDLTKILRVPPGEKDLKNATALGAQDLQPGDRVLVRGQASADGRTISALAVIVMKQSDVAAKQQRDRDDWQKRGAGGLVTKVDAAAGLITISSGGLGANRSIGVHIGKGTVLRRYAPGSVKFDDAKPAPATEIKTGDQLRARGTRSSDGSELSAEEVVTGSFRHIAGTIKAVDQASNTISVQDLISKGTIAVKVSSDSQMKKLPAEMAQRIAMRLKDAGTGGPSDQPGAKGSGMPGQTAPGGVEAKQPSAEPPGMHGPGGNGSPDFQRMLSRLPNATLADLQKGDAVMIVATEGGASEASTAITLLAGVDAILTASPNRGATSLLSPWSLSTGGGEGDAGQP
jgi:hypothetical protein